MPKELIHSDPALWNDDDENRGYLELRWSRETDSVQVASVVLRKSDHSPVTREVQGGWYIDLNRRSINQLIRNLRRARDQAFGKDE